MKTVYSREGDFLVYGVWQVNILLNFFLPFNYQLPIMVVPTVTHRDFVYWIPLNEPAISELIRYCISQNLSRKNALCSNHASQENYEDKTA